MARTLAYSRPAERVDGAPMVDIDDRTSQPFPSSGSLTTSLNLGLGALRARVGEQNGEAHCYVVASVYTECGRFVQGGCGPNFQGGLITLCTCKHRMRARMDGQSWVDKWVAGFSGINTVGDGARYLVYLMRVGQVAASQSELWHALPDEVREAKAADTHKHGDLYRPCHALGAEFDPRSYTPPHADHVHASGNAWHNDIAYSRRSRRMPALLVCDPEDAYVWDRPVLAAGFDVRRPYTLKTLGDVLSHLTGGDPR